MPRGKMSRFSQSGERPARSRFAITAGKLVLAGAALGLLATSGNGQATAAQREFVVTMANMSYGRIPSGVKVGDTIVWTNRDTVPHTATARNRAFDIRVAQGQRVRMRVTRAGSFPIYCIYHPTMRGSLTVAAR